jgi:outer membrane cobalamin receptor
MGKDRDRRRLGGFILKALPAGKYYVIPSALGYSAGSQTVDVRSDVIVSCNFELQKESASLSEVPVTARKPFIEMSLGKIVADVGGSTATGASNVLELMRRLPGVRVDGNGSITMQGKEGVLAIDR